MPRILLLICAFMALGTCLNGQASTDHGTVFGVRLGMPVGASVGECALKKLPFRNHYWYPRKDQTPCYRREYGGKSEFTVDPSPVSNEVIEVDFPESSQPAIAKAGILFATVIDGKIETVQFITPGSAAETEVMAALANKYGAPTRSSTDDVHNRLGGTFKMLLAIWDLADIYVRYQSITKSIDDGFVTICTPSGLTVLKSGSGAQSGRPL